MRYLTHTRSVLVIAALAAPGASFAQELSGSVGAGAIYLPKYLGADQNETRFYPALDLSYGDDFYLSTTQGLGWNAWRGRNWTLSPFVGYTLGRDNDDKLSGMDEVDGSFTAGLRYALQYDPNWSFYASAQAPFTGDVDGFELSTGAVWSNRLAERWVASLSPSVTYSSESWTDSMFSVSGSESARSGVRAYDADSGYLRFGINGSLSYFINHELSVTAFAGVTRLTGEAKDSSIVDDIGDATQAYGGGFVSYHF